MMKIKIKEIIAIIVLLVLPIVASAEPIKLTDIHLANEISGTHIEFILTQPTVYHVFTLHRPDRLVVDLADTQLDLNLKKIMIGSSTFKNIRSGHPDASTLRLVLDLQFPIKFRDMSQKHKVILNVYAAPVDVAEKPSWFSSFFSRMIGSDAVSTERHASLPDSSVVSSKRVSPASSSPKSSYDASPTSTYGTSLTSSRRTPSSSSGGLSAGSRSAEVSSLDPADKPRNDVGRTYSSRDDVGKTYSTHDDVSKARNSKNNPKPTTIVSKPPPHTTVIVVIDPGHGGKDSGAVGNSGAKEKNIVLAISQRLAKLINQQPHMRAVLTRSGDYYVPLRERLKLARKGRADLFIAIHADSFF